MKIDDIPLPPIILGKHSKEVKGAGLNVELSNKITNTIIPMKRINNDKLPLGLLLKDSFSKTTESTTSKKEIFLPNKNDRIPLTSEYSRSEVERINKPFSKNHHEYTKGNSDIKTKSKRKSEDDEDCRISKRYREDRRIRERRGENNGSRIRSQVVVRDRGDSHRNIQSRHVYSRVHEHSKYNEYDRDKYRDKRRNSPKRRQLKRQSHRSPRRHRSPSRRPKAHSSHKHHHSTERNGHYRDKYFHSSNGHLHKTSRKVDISAKRKHSSSKKSSSHTSSSTQSSGSYNEELPIVSPKSPEESPKKKTLNVERPKVSPVKSPAEIPTTGVTAANIYLKQLKETLDKINDAYKNVVAQIPDQKICPDLELSNIPLPSSVIPPEEQTKEHIDTKIPDIPTVIVQAQPIINGHKPSPIGFMARSNSINADKLSCISDSSMGSKVFRSPLHSFNVSSYSKDSENSDNKSRPIIPKITNYHIDYSNIDPSLFSHYYNDFLIDKITCHCIMPNPDQWTEHGSRACGHEQSCVLRQLRIECNTNRCPTEALCCNRQFQTLDSLSVTGSNAELFFDIRQTMSWKLRARYKAPRNTLLFEVSGKAEVVSDKSDVDESEREILVTKQIKMSLRSDHQSLIYYLRLGGPEEANVHLEKWLVNGRLRVGVFAINDIVAKTELILFYRSDCVITSSMDNDDHSLLSMQSLVHDNVSSDNIQSLLTNLLSTNTPSSSVVLDRCLLLGAIPLLYISSLPHISSDNCNEQILTKLVEFLTLVPYDKISDGMTLGIDLVEVLDHLASLTQSLGPHHNSTFTVIKELRTSLSRASQKRPSYGRLDSKGDSNNLYTLNCRLPMFWCSRECVCDDESRVFFYHKVTKFVQWDMPVYPWETNDDDNADIYDYNNASMIQVTHDEIAQMYLNLNKMYEIKQKRILYKENHPKPSKELSDTYKKEVFRKKMMDFIIRLLKPYRDFGCKEGRITSEDDLRYLANKLAQTILFKELKILNNSVEYLDVTTIVENKTKTYVRTYLQSRGSVYKRPSHQSDTITKKVT